MKQHEANLQLISSDLSSLCFTTTKLNNYCNKYCVCVCVSMFIDHFIVSASSCRCGSIMVPVTEMSSSIHVCKGLSGPFVCSPKFVAAWTVQIVSVPTACAPDNKMDACFEERLCEEIHNYPHLIRNCPPGTIKPNYEPLSVCSSIISTAVHLIDFTLGGCISEDPRKCSVDCEVVWMSGSPETRNNTRGQAIDPLRMGTFSTATALVYIIHL